MRDRMERLAAGAMTRVRTWFDPPLGPDARPLEVRKAIVDAAAARVEPAGGGRRVFPYKCLWAIVLADTAERRAALEGALADLQGALDQQLAELQAKVPPGFTVRVEYVRRAKASWSPGQQFALDYGRDLPGQAVVPPRDPAPVFNAEVIRGTAARSSYALTDRQIRIGRTETPIDERGRPRHNHIAFVEGADEHSRTVGRSHASVRYDAERREYRVFDDGSHNGTRIIRDGRILEVTPRDPVGVTIVSGDEIVVGTAALRVHLTAGD